MEMMLQAKNAIRADTAMVGQINDAVDGSGIRVVARTTNILNTLSQHPDGLTLREIANRVGLPRSTVQRIIGALDQANYVIAASPTSGFRLGPALVSVARFATQSDIVQICHPLIRKLNADCGETVNFAVLGNDKAVVADQVAGVHRIVAVTATGSSLPLHASAGGKAILAKLPLNDLADLRLRYHLAPLTDNTITDWTRLDAELADIRRDGIAYDEEECFPGIRGVAKVVQGPGDEFGAVSIPVPTERFEANRDRLVRVLQSHCEPLQRRFAP
jgi:DNA-binding IclR family transcriptional regulator